MGATLKHYLRNLCQSMWCKFLWWNDIVNIHIDLRGINVIINWLRVSPYNHNILLISIVPCHKWHPLNPVYFHPAGTDIGVHRYIPAEGFPAPSELDYCFF